MDHCGYLFLSCADRVFKPIGDRLQFLSITILRDLLHKDEGAAQTLLCLSEQLEEGQGAKGRLDGCNNCARSIHPLLDVTCGLQKG